MKEQPAKAPPFQRFEALTKKLLSVPKKEVDEKETQRPKRERKPKEA
jgi:hypothetical protein